MCHFAILKTMVGFMVIQHFVILNSIKLQFREYLGLIDLPLVYSRPHRILLDPPLSHYTNGEYRDPLFSYYRP